MLEAERSARIEAQRATRIKDEFLATLSHELRTPLNAILGWTQILKRKADALTPADLKRGIDVIDRNARAQVQLIDDLLDLSRIMAGKVRLDVQQVSLLDVVQSAIDSAEPGAQAKGIRLEARLDPDMPPRVRRHRPSAAGRLEPAQQRDQVHRQGRHGPGALQRVDSHVELSVSDTGIGIAAELSAARLRPLLAEATPRRRAATAASASGLAISKQLVELHGGTIRARSPGEGQGATFFVELPLAGEPAQADAAPAGAAERRCVATAEAPALPRLDGVHVLVVDDEADGRELLRRVLEDQAATVTALSSGEEALSALRRVTPDLIVSDIGMPVMDGYQFMRPLRAREAKGERIPALALTAFARAEDRKRALLAGYQAHLAKPFDVAELVLRRRRSGEVLIGLAASGAIRGGAERLPKPLRSAISRGSVTPSASIRRAAAVRQLTT